MIVIVTIRRTDIRVLRVHGLCVRLSVCLSVCRSVLTVGVLRLTPKRIEQFFVIESYHTEQRIATLY